jgi:RNA polymerase sigma-70 factor (ECF subfamily)
MQTTSDEVLIGRIARGDRLAMQVLYARHHVRLYRFVLRLLRVGGARPPLPVVAVHSS